MLKANAMKPIPRLHLAHLPTPIEELPRLSSTLGGPRLFVKRDDQTGLAFAATRLASWNSSLPKRRSRARAC